MKSQWHLRTRHQNVTHSILWKYLWFATHTDTQRNGWKEMTGERKEKASIHILCFSQKEREIAFLLPTHISRENILFCRPMLCLFVTPVLIAHYKSLVVGVAFDFRSKVNRVFFQTKTNAFCTYRILDSNGNAASVFSTLSFAINRPFRSHHLHCHSI